MGDGPEGWFEDSVTYKAVFWEDDDQPDSFEKETPDCGTEDGLEGWFEVSFASKEARINNCEETS